MTVSQSGYVDTGAGNNLGADEESYHCSDTLRSANINTRAGLATPQFLHS